MWGKVNPSSGVSKERSGYAQFNEATIILKFGILGPLGPDWAPKIWVIFIHALIPSCGVSKERFLKVKFEDDKIILKFGILGPERIPKFGIFYT